MTDNDFTNDLAMDEYRLYHARRFIHLNVGRIDGELPMCRKAVYSPRSLYTNEVAAVTCPACLREIADTEPGIRNMLMDFHN
jgi:hypothetical protein